ncbi:MAG: hypothetical protein HFI92_08460 [Lachnospiraceae bacterium]|nr:hypothetical protein [Lachnospiraceae bacterium]
MLEKIDAAEVVSFDLFDTLVMRKVRSYTNLFELLDLRLRERGICIPDFVRLRVSAEKELSRNRAPRLQQIYKYVLKKTGGNFITASELARLEWEMDGAVLLAREEMCEVFHEAVSAGKHVVITTDSYYSLEQIRVILDRFGLTGCDQVFVSCEYETSKGQELFQILRDQYKTRKILHVGDDEVSDIKMASAKKMDIYRVLSGEELFDALGGLGVESETETISDRLKTGMFISHIFNSPFWFEEEARALSVSDTFQIGYLFCAPVITDFVLWMKEQTEIQKFKQILFCARDGYLVGRLFRKAAPDMKSVYFLTSRTAAIRAGVENEKDIAYVDSMKYFGAEEEAWKVRFGIVPDGRNETERSKEILIKADIQRGNYKKYIEKLNIQNGDIALFDFVAKGTVQMYLQKLFSQHIKGFYFLQLEPEFMVDKGLEIQPFYLDEEKDTSMIFDHYYILETILSSPYAQMEGFDGDGNPLFAAETRSEKDIRCLERAQEGIFTYFEDYLSILPEGARQGNKRLGEQFLSLVNKIQIKDEDFLALKVEDSFFNRMTEITDLL